ncbi:MAG: hypothetical protein OXH70_19310 [Acidobacteria bacterium]|nr:hypothetical protein [Acidobacteriota bacterium]MCY3968390.1 hypothetical protein [Acidobacteriota bacterium]
MTKWTVGSLVVLAILAVAAWLLMQEPTPPSPEDLVGDHPVEIETGPDYRWQVTELVMDERGRHYPQPDPTSVEDLDWKRKAFRRKYGSAAKVGFHEGQVPPDDEFCAALNPAPYIVRLAPRYNLDFTLMIHDVAVTATIDDVIPGFAGGPTALVSLDRVEPLHSYSKSPRYALVPLGRMVARDAVYCSWVDGRRGFDGKRGERVVLIGRWAAGGVVALADQDAGLAVVPQDLKPLESWFGGPLRGTTIQQIEEAARKVVSTGLYDYAAELRHAETDNLWELRRDMGLEVEAATENGCELSGAVRTEEGWTLTTACHSAGTVN